MFETTFIPFFPGHAPVEYLIGLYPFFPGHAPEEYLIGLYPAQLTRDFMHPSHVYGYKYDNA